MAITVGAIYTQFPNFNPEDMIKLMNGRTDFSGNDEIPLSNIASYQGRYSKDLSIFAAKSEGESFIKLVDKDNSAKIQKQAGINSDKADKNNQTEGIIPMDKSIFDIENEKSKK